MNRSAIIVKNLQASQFSVALSNGANKVLSETSDLDIIIYYESWAKLIINPKFGMLMDREMLGATGICVATDLKTAYKLIKTPGPDKKYFYVWNLEWIGIQKAPFNFLHNIYCHKDINLIARSKYHYDILEKVWKKPVAIMNNFSPETLKDVLYGKV